MLLGLISDTHRQVDTTRKALKLLSDRGAQYIIHAGDVCGEEIIEELAALEVPSAFVFGNNDYLRDSDKRLAQHLGVQCLDDGGILELAGKKIAVVHGDVVSTTRQLLQQKPDYLIYGHTHIPADETTGGVRCINPGALHRARPKTCALLDLATNKLDFIQVQD